MLRHEPPMAVHRRRVCVADVVPLCPRLTKTAEVRVARPELGTKDNPSLALTHRAHQALGHIRHGVEHHTVGIETQDDLPELLVGSRVPWVVIHEYAYSAIMEHIGHVR